MRSGSVPMLAELDQYYREEGISAVVFAYKSYPACSAGCAPRKFLTTHEAFVGSEYEKGAVPRHLFISLEPADEWPVSEPKGRRYRPCATRSQRLAAQGRKVDTGTRHTSWRTGSLSHLSRRDSGLDAFWRDLPALRQYEQREV